MKRRVLALLLMGCVNLTEASDMNWHELALTINNIEHQRGGEMAIYVFLPEGFPIQHDKALRRHDFDVTQTDHQLVIKVPDTHFALKAHHDEDRSGALTKNWTGIIPAEGLGFSSGAKLSWRGPPSFKDAAMMLPADGKAEISIIYP